MKVLKFGGTSVGSVERIHALAKLINDGEQKIVVLSAMSGTTNKLVEITNLLHQKKPEIAVEKINKLENYYYGVVQELYITNNAKIKGRDLIKSHFDHIRSFTLGSFTRHEENTLLAQGELISTALFHHYLEEKEINSVLIPALNFMRIDKNTDPDDFYIRINIQREIEINPNEQIYITQGFICRNAYGEIDNLQRGGSDYSASLIGAALEVDEIQIWTDISGIHNNDPRFVEGTQPVSELSFDEAAELAYFGAKILHPTSVLPAKLKNIPVRLKNTLQPEDEGTLISHKTSNAKIKAIAAKDGITVIKVKSGRMLLAYGFLRKIFEVFERFETPIDMITTSEIAVSLTIDNPKYLNEIVKDLESFGIVEVDKEQTIVCVVGNLIAEGKGVALKVIEGLRNVPIRMISYGGSRHNISFLLNTSVKVEALKSLSEHLFRI